MSRCSFITSLSSGPVLRHLTESSITITEINISFFITSPLLRIRQSVKKFTEVYMLVYVCAHILLFYWSDTSLLIYLQLSAPTDAKLCVLSLVQLRVDEDVHTLRHIGRV